MGYVGQLVEEADDCEYLTQYLQYLGPVRQPRGRLLAGLHQLGAGAAAGAGVRAGLERAAAGGARARAGRHGGGAPPPRPRAQPARAAARPDQAVRHGWVDSRASNEG